MTIAVLIVVWAGCAINSGVVSTGANTYIVSRQAATGFSGVGNLRVEALQEATQYCTSQGKNLNVLNTYVSSPPYILGNFPRAEVQFSCANSGEADTARPTPRSAPPPNPTSIVTGSAFVVLNPRTLVTAFHVVKDADAIEVLCGGSVTSAAKVERIDPANDLAVLRLSSPAPAHLDLAPDQSVSVGQQVFTFGFPAPGLLGTDAKYTDGAISSLSGIAAGIAGAANVLQITVPIQPGNSGGPLSDQAGRVVGVITSTAAVQAFLRSTGTLPQNVNWAVRVEYLRPLLAGIVQESTGQKIASPIEWVRQSSCLLRAVGK